MKICEKPPARNWSSFLNPRELLSIPRYIWSAISDVFGYLDRPRYFDREVVVLTSDQNDRVDWTPVDVFMNISTNPYSTIPFELGPSTKLAVAKYFLTDMERIGQPDEFWINGEKVIGPIQSIEEKRALLRHMIDVAKGDIDQVTVWTTIWNHRPKMVLCDRIKESLSRNRELNPKGLVAVIRTGNFNKVSLSLDTRTGELKSYIQGVVDWGTDVMADLFPFRVKFSAGMTFDEVGSTIEFRIIYS